jgi:transposase
MRGRKRPVFLILDGHPAHIAKLVTQYVQRLAGRLELHFLPGYAPELNPDEFVWNHLKRQGVSKTPLRRDESLRSRVQSDLAHIQSRPALIRSFFHAQSVAYTRD